MKYMLIAAAAALVMGACSPAAEKADPAPPVQVAVSPDAANIQATVADARRPAEDTARDAARHPAETLVFAGIEPGVRVGEIFPGGGYFTRLFAVAAGEEGRV